MIPGTMLSLQTNQQFAKIGIQTELAEIMIRQPRLLLELRQIPARMEVDQGSGELRIDSEDARAAVGNKPILRMTHDIAQQAKAIGMEAIRNIAEEGDQLASIEKGISIADIAVQRQELGPMPIVDVDPPSPVHVTYTAYPFRIHWIRGGVEVTPHLSPVEIQYRPGAVEVYVAQKNWLEISVKGQYMNRTL